jgi:hypothetical protein
MDRFCFEDILITGLKIYCLKYTAFALPLKRDFDSEIFKYQRRPKIHITMWNACPLLESYGAFATGRMVSFCVALGCCKTIAPEETYPFSHCHLQREFQ